MTIEAGTDRGVAHGLPRAADECVDLDGVVRPPYSELLATLERAAGSLPRIRRDAQQWFADRGVTFGVPTEGVAPIFPFDPVPRVLSSGEWRALSRALSQRAMALDLFVSDCYGAQRAIRHGAVPGRLVYSSTGYLRDIVGIRPPRATWCHVSGIDVVRVKGTFHVLEDNVRIPSGIAYALEFAARDGVTGAGMVRAGAGPTDPWLHRPAPSHPAAHRPETVGRRHRGAHSRLV